MPGPFAGRQMLRILRDTGGLAMAVTEQAIVDAQRLMAKMEGISMEPAAGVAFAGLIKLVRAGTIGPEDVVVVNCSGHTFPIQNEILGEGWARDVELPEPSAEPNQAPVLAAQPQEGLLAALHRLDERVRSIVIVDDNPDAARLIRRILQAKGSYDIQQAGTKKKPEAVTAPATDEPRPEDIAVTGDGTSFPPSAAMCHKCSTKAVVIMDGCATCLNCGYSKCG